MKFSIVNFGCRANQADGAALAGGLERAGLTAAEEAEADWVIVNTCTVTAEADAAARRAIGRIHRQRPRARIVVTGCYAERAAEEVRALAGVSLVAGHAQKWNLASQLVPLEPPLQKLAILARLNGRTRPTLKVQEGCGRACSFCVIPQVRGSSRSRALGEIMEEAGRIADAGHAEVVISGINLGQWGRDLDGGLRLSDLVRALLERTAVQRVRLSSVEPMDWTPELTALMAAGGGRLARHVHWPLQSGSDAVLRRMRRRYRACDYAARVEELASGIEGVAIGADVMVGFPGESEAEFEQTYALVERLPLAYLHVFPFSARPGTEAERQLARGVWSAIPGPVAAARATQLRALGAAKREQFLEQQLGRALSAVTLSGGEALSDNYATVRLAGPAVPGRLIEVRAWERRGEVLLAS